MSSCGMSVGRQHFSNCKQIGILGIVFVNMHVLLLAVNMVGVHITPPQRHELDCGIKKAI